LTFYANGTVSVSQHQIAHFKGVTQGDIQIYAFNKPEPLALEHQNFRDAVLGRSSDIVNLESGTQTVKVAEAMIESSLNQKAVNL
jgi:predicted dehydrogenase